MLRNAVVGEGCQISQKNYEDVRFNIISITIAGKFPEKALSNS